MQVAKKKQFLVDYTYQYEFAKIAAMNGVENYSLVSSIGANKNSFLFYPKIKGMLEEEIKSLNFQNIQIYQPPSLIRQVDLSRKGEKLVISILNFLNKLGLLTSLKPLKVRDLAKKMINESFKHKEIKIQIFQSRDLI